MGDKKDFLKLFNNKKIINIESYIQACLYSNQGYYKNTNAIGRSGDFITAPEISQLFGEIVGLFILNYWQNNIKKEFNLIELGPGKGTLLIDILNITKSFTQFREKSNIYLIEKNISLIKEQKKNLSKNNLKLKNIAWLKNFDIKNDKPSIIFANEFFDCLPIRQFYKKENKWFEKMVQINHENTFVNLVDKEVNDLKNLNIINQYKSNTVLEISKSREEYFSKVCRHISKNGGQIIVIDYGYYARPKYLTLQSVYNNKKSNILDNIGKQDISSLIDFRKLIDIANINKLKTNIFCSQRDFLLNHGIVHRLKKNLIKSNNKQAKIMKLGLEKIIDKKSMGSLFKVLVLSKK